jgi:hypothetical protein
MRSTSSHPMTREEGVAHILAYTFATGLNVVCRLYSSKLTQDITDATVNTFSGRLPVSLTVALRNVNGDQIVNIY